MATTLDQIRFMIYDLKYSWYFRVWGFIWFVGMVFSFAVLIMLSQRADEAGNELDLKLKVENVSELTYPLFHFRVSNRAVGELFASKSCVHNGVPVLTGQCQAIDGVTPSRDTCFSVSSDQVVVTNTPNGNTDITCYINTTGFQEGGNTMIAWGVEGNSNVIGPNSYSDLFIAPNDNAHVILRARNFYVGSQKISNWERSLVYHSSISTPGQYIVKAYIANFIVVDMQREDSYDGYRAMGDIGGFFYFMIILHTFVMILVGACLVNNSKFLGGDLVSH